MALQIIDYKLLSKIIDEQMDEIKIGKIEKIQIDSEHAEYKVLLDEIEVYIKENTLQIVDKKQNKDINASNASEIDIVIKNKILGLRKDIYINNILIGNKKHAEFILNIVESWNELKSLPKLPEYKHPFYDYTDEAKEEYILTLEGLLRLFSNKSAKIYQYINNVGLGLVYTEESTWNFRKVRETIINNSQSVKQDKINYKDIKENYIFFQDFIVFFINTKEPVPKISKVEKALGENLSKKVIEFYKCKVNELNENNRKLMKIEKILDKKGNIKMENIFEQDIFHKNILKNIRGPRVKMGKKARFEFQRDNQHYYYIYESQNNENIVEYPAELEKNEENLIIIDEENKREHLKFDEIIKSKNDEVLKESLIKKYPSYKKEWEKVEFEEMIGLNFPKITYSDITEKKILGYGEILQEHLATTGVWSEQGDRWLEVKFSEFLAQITEEIRNNNAKIDYSLHIEQVGNMQKYKKIEIGQELTTNLEEENPTKDLVISFPINTDLLEEYIENNAESVILTMSFELVVYFPDKDTVLKYGIPIIIKIMNPSHEEHNIKSSRAAIDFGTSATCIAFQKSGEKKLLSLESLSTHESSKAYENPTNLLIKNWEEFYGIWKDREKCPVINRYNDINSDIGCFSQGHEVRNNTMLASRPELKAQINQLKTIPYNILTLSKEQKATPYKTESKGIKEIKLICDCDNQGEEALDPISFYGYLLGRALFLPADKVIITKFSVTMPVKFENNVKQAILKSLEMGIKIAAPKKVREKIVLEEGNSEPVAFIGAVSGMKLDGRWGPGSKFAVFDLGGGTLDLAFGNYRDANEDREDEEDYDRVIEVINTAGDETRGAEYLIHKLSYAIYKGNKDKMKEERIPFTVPHSEKLIELFDEQLQNAQTISSNYNVKVLNEKISRFIFEGREDQIETHLEMQRQDGSFHNIDIEMPIEEIKGMLEYDLEKTVDIFKNELEKNFTEENRYENMHIFRAGNASRSEIIEKLMNDKFSDKCKIHFIDEDSVHGIHPKTAVVLGELKLKVSSETGVVFKNKQSKDVIPFEYIVGSQDLDDHTILIEKISKGSTSTEWVNLGRANKDSKIITVYYTKTIGQNKIDENHVKMSTIEIEASQFENGNKVWGRAKSGNTMEYIISKAKPEKSIKGTEHVLKRY